MFGLCTQLCASGLSVCMYASLSGGDSRLQRPPSPCLAFPIFDLSKGCSGHSIIGMLSDFLFVMITQNNKSEITFFVRWEEGDRQGFTASYSLTRGPFLAELRDKSAYFKVFFIEGNNGNNFLSYALHPLLMKKAILKEMCTSAFSPSFLLILSSKSLQIIIL